VFIRDHPINITAAHGQNGDGLRFMGRLLSSTSPVKYRRGCDFYCWSAG
jgi:hypothetical protein